MVEGDGLDHPAFNAALGLPLPKGEVGGGPGQYEKTSLLRRFLLAYQEKLLYRNATFPRLLIRGN